MGRSKTGIDDRGEGVIKPVIDEGTVEWLAKCDAYVKLGKELNRDPHVGKGHVRSVRTLMGLSVREFAERVGISFAYVSRLENGLPETTEVCARVYQALKRWLDQ